MAGREKDEEANKAQMEAADDSPGNIKPEDYPGEVKYGFSSLKCKLYFCIT